MRQYAPGLGAGIFLERAVLRKATGGPRGAAALLGHRRLHLVPPLCLHALPAVGQRMSACLLLLSTWHPVDLASCLLPAELTEARMQDSEAGQETIRAAR